MEESQDRTSRRLKQKLWRIVLAGSHADSHATCWLPRRLTRYPLLPHRLTRYPLGPTQTHTLPSGSHAGSHATLCSHTGSHIVGFLYIISGPPAQWMVWLTVAWAFLLQLMIKTLSQRCTLEKIWSGQSLAETPFSSDCVELRIGVYSNISQDEQLFFFN